MTRDAAPVYPRTSSAYWENWTPGEIDREITRVLANAHTFVEVPSMMEDVHAPGSYAPLYRHADDCPACSALAAIECLVDAVRRG